MEYTDLQLKDASQVAYMQCFPEAEKKLLESGQEKPFTVRQLIEASVSMKDIKLNAIENEQVTSAMDFQELIQYSGLSDEDKKRVLSFQEETLNWKVIDIHDKNQENGFYACTLETGDSQAIVAFRGSESYGNNFVDDFLLSDLGLLNSTKTIQQAETEKYASELISEGVLDKYDFVAATGHSLGGNLATHFNVTSAMEGNEVLYDKLKQVVNLDGPGMSHDYMEKYSNELARSSTKLTHYKWSAVGNLLFDPPGEKIEFLNCDEELHSDKNPLMKSIWRHDTNTLYFDENGMSERGKQDGLSKVLGPVTRIIDKSARDTVISLLCGKMLGGGAKTVKDVIGLINVAGKTIKEKSEKKSAAVDVLGDAYNDKEMNRSSIDNITNFFNNKSKDNLLSLNGQNGYEDLVMT